MLLLDIVGYHSLKAYIDNYVHVQYSLCTRFVAYCQQVTDL